MPRIGERAIDGTGKRFCGWALFCHHESFTHDPWPTWAQARAHVEATAAYGSCPAKGADMHTIVEVWKQGRVGVELGSHYPTDVEIADLAAYAIELGIAE